MQILIARWCLAGRIVLSSVVPLNITMTHPENVTTGQSVTAHILLCCLHVLMPKHPVKFNPSQTRQTQG